MVLFGCAMQALLATPAWAHPGTGPHVHVEQLFPVVTLGAVVVTLLLQWRSRARAR
jgi:hypothetical protein